MQSKIQKTTFVLEFILNAEEKKEFKETIGSQINGFLPIQIEISKTGKTTISIQKAGKAHEIFAKKKDVIADFIAKKINFNYIPAVRTDDDAMEVVQSLVSTEFKSLEENPDYAQALKTIQDIRQPLLENVSRVVQENLQEFIPSINTVKIGYDETHRRYMMRGNVNIIIDDGVPTNLEYKGDGVKSLVTLGLLKNRYNTGLSSIIAIEEPESHLHPLAIHRLKEIVKDLSKKSQVLISTHNPLFVNRLDLDANILVEDGTAIQKPSLKRIRNTLGVKASDNLINAEYAIIVEGETDKIFLEKYIEKFFPKLNENLKKEEILIYPMGGMKNLKTTLCLFSTCVCETYLIADDDQASKQEIEKAVRSMLLQDSNYTILKCNPKESEIEDLYKISSYLNHLNSQYGLSLTENQLKGNKKWSERIKDILENSGKIFDKDAETRLKYNVVEIVIKDIQNNIDIERCKILKNCLEIIEQKFNSK